MHHLPSGGDWVLYISGSIVAGCVVQFLPHLRFTFVAALSCCCDLLINYLTFEEVCITFHRSI